MVKRDPLTVEDAERLALQGLTFLAGDATRLARFLALTGIGPAELRNWEGNHTLQSAVLEHFLGDESLLLVFASEVGMAPEGIGPAQALLAQQG